MTQTELLTLIEWVLGFVIIGVAAGIVTITRHAFMQANLRADMDVRLTKTSENLKASEELVGHLVRAGESIKTQLNNHELLIQKVTIDLSYLKEGQAMILHAIKELKK